MTASCATGIDTGFVTLGYAKVAILGVVQGITELLPISSTAHMRIVPALLGWQDPGSAFSAAMQLAALAANFGVALLLYRYRTGDANMRSVWICSRNDAIGNIAVMLAALGVFGTGSAWPDLIVATIMAALALTGGVQVLRQALSELRIVAQ